jgi:hypothetical protein
LALREGESKGRRERRRVEEEDETQREGQRAGREDKVEIGETVFKHLKWPLCQK